MIKGITDEKKLDSGRLTHTFLGTDKKGTVSGYHCDIQLGDEVAYAEAKLYPKSKRRITRNGSQRLFEANVRSKKTGKLKELNGGKSSFFCADWNRQQVVDAIARSQHPNQQLFKRLQTNKNLRNSNGKMMNVTVDPNTGIVIVNTNAGYYPLLKY